MDLNLEIYIGRKDVGKDFSKHLRSCMRHVSFVSYPADPYVWMGPAKCSNGSIYYEYILIYTDDCFILIEKPEHVIQTDVGRYFVLKEDLIGPYKMYLGRSVRKVQPYNGIKCLAFRSVRYVQAAVNNVEEYIVTHSDERWKLPYKAKKPMRNSYQPYIYLFPKLGPSDTTYYISLINILQFIVEIGRLDICIECSMTSYHLYLTWEVHLYEVFQMFGYLNKYHTTEIVYDPSNPVICESSFEL